MIENTCKLRKMEGFKTLSKLSFKANPIRITSCKPRDGGVKKFK